MPKLYDVAILGATPGGYAAAACLARKKRDVVVIDAPSDAALTCPLHEWLPKTLFDLAEIPRKLAKDTGATPFKKVRYINAQYDDTAEYVSPVVAGYFVNPASLRETLKARANAAGVRTVRSATPPVIELKEDHAAVMGSRQTRACMLLITQGRPSNILAMLSRHTRRPMAIPMTCVGLDIPLARKLDMQDVEGTLHVVERPERSEMGMFFVGERMLHLRIISTSVASGNRAEELSGMLRGLQQADVLPAELGLGKASGALWHPTAGVALDLETHEAKRCLLAGSAGGFAESVSGHALLPQIHSSLLAAETIHRALDADKPQNELMTFREVWRKELADYLRPPNTSLQMLLPLLFVNKRIVTKFTRSLLYGEDI